MLKIIDICKQYKTGDLIQKALDHVDLALRDNEFVAILGPSGSGKTTLLNVIGGLDRYDSGDLVIDGITTKKYKDRDWDSYRNHKIGFIFQNYNLIPHQSILANVELALTISGLSRSQRKKKAMAALEDVGLAEQAHKRPSQLSGGQMQRVAIARALVNDPQILLADEPTGALDTETSISVMELLKKVARDRLVVMVTHNPELADTYATRIVRLRDGKITADSDPYVPEETAEPEHKRLGKASMSFATSLGLSANNLRTKKGRTILTAFAGSIGIIGIALILSLSNGVSQALVDIQKDTMSSYPISIDKTSYNIDALVDDREEERKEAKKNGLGHDMDAVYGNNDDLSHHRPHRISENYIIKNNLTAFKKYLDDPSSEINEYIGENGVVYSYDTNFMVYSYDAEDEFSNVVGRSGTNRDDSLTGMLSFYASSSTRGIRPGSFSEMLPGKKDDLVSPVITENYELLYGHWPENAYEMAFIVNKKSEVQTELMYDLGYLKRSEYNELIERMESDEEVELPDYKWDYKTVVGKEFYILPLAKSYMKDGDLYRPMENDEIEKNIDKTLKVSISCVIRPKEDAKNASIATHIAYTKALTDLIISETDLSDAVLAQKDDHEKNVVTGLVFDPASDAEKIENTKLYLKTMSFSELAYLYEDLIMTGKISGGLMNLGGLGGLDSIAGILRGESGSKEVQSDDVMTEMMINSLDDDTLLSIYNTRISSGSYEEALNGLGVVDRESPRTINIYVDTFAAKEKVTDCIDKYNETASAEDQITFNDVVGLLLESVTDVVDATSYVLIAFVAVSLIVSSIMIGIITYISVLERTREIGILRALGASKRNISQVFNAETFLVGLLAGIFGIVFAGLFLIPINAIIRSLAEGFDVSAKLPLLYALLLIALSTFLTMIGGFIPAKKAAKRDPVAALRSE